MAANGVSVFDLLGLTVDPDDPTVLNTELSNLGLDIIQNGAVLGSLSPVLTELGLSQSMMNSITANYTFSSNPLAFWSRYHRQT